MVAEALTYTYEDRCGVRWHLANRRLAVVAESVSRIAHADRDEMCPGEVQVLNERGHRRVLRVATTESEHQTVVAKIFRLSSLCGRLRHQVVGCNRFALGEAANLITAARRGLAVPRVYGYGCARGWSRLVRMDFLLTEDLAFCVPVGQLFERHAADRAVCAEILGRMTPVFVGLFRAGCNHIDVNLGAILLDSRDWAKVFLLDFEHATFRRTPSLEILAFEAAYFAGCCRRWVDKDALEKWFAELVHAAGVTDAIERRVVTDRFNHYLNRALSRRQRRRIR